MGRGSELHGLSSLGNLRQVPNEVLKYVEQREIAVVVEVYVNHMLGIWSNETEVQCSPLKTMAISRR